MKISCGNKLSLKKLVIFVFQYYCELIIFIYLLNNVRYFLFNSTNFIIFYQLLFTEVVIAELGNYFLIIRISEVNEFQQTGVNH